MPTWLTHWFPIIIGVGILANGVRLRGRLRRLDTVPASGRPADPHHEFLVARGVRLSEAARRAASYYASRERLDVLDLVPADLTIERALDVARMVDTRTYRKDRAAPGRGAFQALLVDADVLRRAGIEARDDFDPVELVEVTERLKRYASVSTDLAVIPGLKASRDNGAKRLAVQRRVYRWQPLNGLFPLVRDVGIGIGMTINKPAALPAMALFWLQPFFVCAGRVPIAPRDLARSPVVRITAGIEFAVSSVRAGRARSRAAAQAKAAGRPVDPAKDAKAAADATRREYYRNEAARGLGRFFDPRSGHCPWCFSTDLTTRLVSPDVYLRKPGRFRYDQCGGCGHVFQNPRLSFAGLDFYYRDCYDGPGAETAEVIFESSAGAYRDRAELMRPFTEPRTWLDVGTGHGHFCNHARDVWPDTVFDGLDMTDGIDEARRRGWVDHAYRGMFPDLVGAVAGRYDVISMFHYLEHTTDPLAELDAAAKALPPGSYLFIEVPNPESPAARLVGRYWVGWFVPQHLHMIPADNLAEALAERGLRVVATQFGESNQPLVAVGALFAMVQGLRPFPWLPWLPKPPTPLRTFAWALTMAVLAPAFAAAGLFDAAAAPYFRRGRRATAYRVVARKES
jgi:2-polyprenyl-3-methyl-5-hydroxy-6-metoxy-1,4-benzoquinol methylase